MPKWGFVDAKRESAASAKPHQLTKSLIFDQSFDSKKIRPVPAFRMTSIPIAAAIKKKATPATKLVDTVAPPVKSATPARAEVVTEAAVRIRPRNEAARLITALTKPRANAARVLVVDEESLALNDPHPIVGAEVHWVSTESGLSKRTGANGMVTAPYPETISTRFVVTAPGYLPAVGYAVTGQTSAVTLIKESRIGPVLKTLGVAPDPERSLIIGKVLRPNLSPAEKVTVDASVENPFRVFYSIGSFGLYHPNAHETGAQGDFLVSGFARGLQYLMPAEAGREWPSWTIDTSELPAFASATIVDSKPVTVQTQIVDSMSLERPEVGVHVTIGGQRGLFLPDEEGYLSIEDLYARSSSDLLEVRAQGYMKTWLSAVASPKLFPSLVSLFTRSQLDHLFRQVSTSIDSEKGLVFGNLRPERYTRPVNIQIFGPSGKRSREASVLYFDSNNHVSGHLKQTDPVSQNFAVANLDAGEWHVIVTDVQTGKGLSVQVVRVENGTISQVQF